MHSIVISITDMGKVFNLTKRWLNHEWKEKYGCVNKTLRKKNRACCPKDNYVNKDVWKECDAGKKATFSYEVDKLNDNDKLE